MKPYTDKELLYSESDRCICGAGLAYPEGGDALLLSSWICSDVLKGAVEPDRSHDRFPFAFYKIREETSINGSGRTTRPPGTICRTVGKATCPKCQCKWESEPYSAAGASHHWLSGPCPSCGYAVGSGVSYSSNEGPAIEVRFSHVVLEDKS